MKGLTHIGITRIKIVSHWDDWRTRMAQDLSDAANVIYRKAFAALGMELLPGVEVVLCSKADAISRYDYKEGIDVILCTTSGTRMTLQEKFLTYNQDTMTFEERKTRGTLGAWYYCTAQYYFTGYARRYRIENVREFQSWMLVDLPRLHRASDAGEFQWGDSSTRTAVNPLGLRQNGRDDREASFRFVHFNSIPSSCVVARGPNIITNPPTAAQASQLALFGSVSNYDTGA